MRPTLSRVRIFAALAPLTLAQCATTQPQCPAATTPAMPHNQHTHQGQHGRHGEGFHRRFDDAQRWAQVFDDPARDAWQRPDEVIRWLALAPDARVADLGAGTGYFAARLARAVPSGRVWAEDIEPTLVVHMQQRFVREGIANAFATLGTAESPLVPELVDLVLVVDTYHHISDRPAFFQRIRERLRPSGRVVIVDFRMSATMGPPAEHRLAPAVVTQEMTEAGYTAGPALDTLPNQYVLSFVANSQANPPR
ncbi:MAG: class I SAM-dependent methyltransferase [Deltaproteobacteria bacterium]|nr:class I SAM-dependent methyltransferase [Deltaproteobacteria bacterium]